MFIIVRNNSIKSRTIKYCLVGLTIRMEAIDYEVLNHVSVKESWGMRHESLARPNIVIGTVLQLAVKKSPQDNDIITVYNLV